MKATSDWMYHQPAAVGHKPAPNFDVDKHEVEFRFVNEPDDTWDRSVGGLSWYPDFLYRIRPKVAEQPENSLPEDDGLRNEFPMFDGLFAYFPNALAEVARISKIGNDQHNPGEPLHWARDKSTDHANKIARHLVDVGKKDARGARHSVRLAWRALALAQEELEREEGYPLSRGSTPA